MGMLWLITEIWCFNPCFIGLASATKKVEMFNRLQLLLFQSLFYWISLCDYHSKYIRLPNTLFQSLFYWISLCDIGIDSKEEAFKGMFQSLFYWISLCDFNIIFRFFLLI